MGKKNIDWYITSLIPLLIIGIIMLMSYIQRGALTTLNLAIEQILTFSLLLSTADLAKRASWSPSDKKTTRLLPLITIILATGLLFVFVGLGVTPFPRMVVDAKINNSPFTYVTIHSFFFILSIITMIISLLFYYFNPAHNEKTETDIVNEREEDLEDAQNYFEEKDNG